MARDLREAAPTAPLEPTAAVPEVERTDVLPVSPQGPASTEPLPATVTRDVRRRWWPFAAVAGALAALALALALTLGRENPLPTASPSPTSSVEPTSPAPTTTTPPPILSLEAAIAQFESALGGLDSDVQNELVDRANEALESFDRGDRDQALEKIGELRGKAEELAGEEEISSSDADALLAAVAGLESAIQAAEVPAGDDSGRGRGKAKGKDKGEDD